MKRKTNTKQNPQPSGSNILKRPARRFPLSDHIDAIMNSCPDEEHLVLLLRLEQSYEAAYDALQQVTISDTLKHEIAVDQLASFSYGYAKVRGDSLSDLQDRATAGRHEWESRWHYNDLW